VVITDNKESWCDILSNTINGKELRFIRGDTASLFIVQNIAIVIFWSKLCIAGSSIKKIGAALDY